ncbi:MAG TPA: NAD(+)/NADH kinase [Methylophilaceae bacterium]|nr:NAD(+)/NADH kinase [Methylophilaceae bacterium]
MSTNQRVALYGGSFNPPGLHHRRIVEQLTKEFDLVLVVPCGFRSDKKTTNFTSLLDRAVMADHTFGDVSKCLVLPDDLVDGNFTTTWAQLQRYQYMGDVSVVLGADLLSGGRMSPVYSQWEQGQQLWENASFVCVPMKSFPVKQADLPPKCRVLNFNLEGSQSTAIREEIFHGHQFREYVVPRVHDYIQRYNVYRPGANVRQGLVEFDPGKPVIVEFDEGNEKAAEFAKCLVPTSDPSAAQAIVSIGGDGFMLQTIRKHCGKRLPFLGLNAGHRGFLLNDVAKYPLLQRDLHGTFHVYQMPLLRVTFRMADGVNMESDLAFNDVWVQSAMGRTAWMEVTAGKDQCLPRLVADALLVSTPAGSTAYAHSMGATPLLIGSPALLMVGSNVIEPNFKWAPVPLDSKIEVRTLDRSGKRPLFGFVDGRDVGEVISMTVEVSNTAAAELMFAQGHDIAAKISQIHFPSAK